MKLQTVFFEIIDEQRLKRSSRIKKFRSSEGATREIYIEFATMSTDPYVSTLK